MPLNKPFQHQATALASYSHTDIDDGTGIVIYQGYSHKEEAVLSYGLSKETVSPETKTTLGTGSASGTNKCLDLDFDTLQKLPKEMDGKFKAEISTSYTGGSQGCVIYFIVKVREWDGTTETEIASCQTSSSTNAVSTTLYKQFLAEVEIPRTHFKSGDTIRVTLECWIAAGTQVGNVTLYHDPTDTLASGSTPYSSQLNFHIPFQIDL